MLSNLLYSVCVAIAASRALAAPTVTPTAGASISATQALDLLNNLVTGLQSAGDARAKLEAATPSPNAQTVIPLLNGLTTAFNDVMVLFPEGILTGYGVTVGATTDAQQTSLCALIPIIKQAGDHATDALIGIPEFHDDAAAKDAENALGTVSANLSWSFGALYYGLYNAGASVKCNADAQNILLNLDDVFGKFSDALFY